MKGLLVIAYREIREKRLIFVAAVLASCIALAIPVTRGLRGVAASEVRDLITILVATAFAVGLACGLGASVIAKDIVDRRIGFYLSRPLSAFELWAGKIGAVCLVITGSAALILLPVWLLRGFSFPRADTSLPAVSAITVGAILLIPLCHAASIIARSRSPMAALDVIAFAAAGALLISGWRRFFLMLGPPLMTRLALSVAAVTAIGLLVAGYQSVARGRSDVRASHKALSAALWSAVAVGIAASYLYASWVLAAGVHALKEAYVVQTSDSGNPVIVSGSARGVDAQFVLDLKTGHSIRTGLAPVLSADGKRAAWLERSDVPGNYDLVVQPWNDSSAKPARTQVSLSDLPFWISPEGDLVASKRDGILTVHDLIRRATSSVRIPNAGFVRAFFSDRSHVELLRLTQEERGACRLTVQSFDVTSRQLRTLAELREPGWVQMAANADGSEILVREGRGTRVLLVNVRENPATVSTLVEGPDLDSGRAMFLPDGRILVADGRFLAGEATRTAAQLRLFTRDGKPEKTIPLHISGPLTIGGEAAPGMLLVAIRLTPYAKSRPHEMTSLETRRTTTSGERSLFLVDLESGDVKSLGNLSLSPVASSISSFSRANTIPIPGSPVTKLFYDEAGPLVYFDPFTGERRVILQGHAR